MTTRSFAPDERFDQHMGVSDYANDSWTIYAKRDGDTATLKASGPSNADDRDSIAARLATLTESWTIKTIRPRREWLITYRVTHRIIPIEEVQP